MKQITTITILSEPEATREETWLAVRRALDALIEMRDVKWDQMNIDPTAHIMDGVWTGVDRPADDRPFSGTEVYLQTYPHGEPSAED